MIADLGWVRFPARNATNGKGKEGRGIGSHTDYGLLVISAQDDVGGWFILSWFMVGKLGETDQAV